MHSSSRYHTAPAAAHSHSCKERKDEDEDEYEDEDKGKEPRFPQFLPLPLPLPATPVPVPSPSQNSEAQAQAQAQAQARTLTPGSRVSAWCSTPPPSHSSSVRGSTSTSTPASFPERVQRSFMADFIGVAGLLESLEAQPPYSRDYLEYVTASCTPVEAGRAAFMIVVVPASQMWVAWVASEHKLVVIGLQALAAFLCAYGLSCMIRACSLPRTFRKFFEVSCSLALALGYLLMGLVAWYFFNVFPVPLGQLSYSMAWSAFIHPASIVILMEPEARRDPVRRQAVLTAYLLHLGLVVLLGSGAPLSLAAHTLLRDWEVAQVLTLLAPWLLRKAFEALGRRLFSERHPELIPTTRLIAISLYEGYLSIIMMSTADFEWYVVPMAIACDLMENFIYLLLIRQTVALARREETTLKLKMVKMEETLSSVVVGRPSAQLKDMDIVDTVCSTSGGSSNSNSSSGSDDRLERRNQGLIGLVASVLVKEVMEVVIPLQVLATMAGMYVLNPKWNALCAGVGPADYQRGVLMLLADVLLEACMLMLVMVTVKCVTCTCTCIQKPWSLLVRVIHHDLHTMGAMVMTGLMVNICFQHTYHGSDLTLQFRWLQEGAVWHGGMCWTFGEETPQQVCRPSWHSESG